MGLDGKSGDPIPFSARYEVDRQKQREAAFAEGWRALNDWFYDPGFHGVDWVAQRERYRPWALAATHPEDFADMMNLMQGDLNASHLGYSPPHEDGGETTGWIGALFDPEARGPGLRIREVLPESPAARLDVNLQPGERILAVNGVKVEPSTNIYAHFADTVDQRVALKVRAKDGDTRTVVVTPVNRWAQRQLRYRNWVRQRREMVEKLSGGRLGYIHIQSMGIPSFESFERNLYAAGHGKDGLIIDVRFNSGGWTTDYLLAVLSVRRHSHTVPRDGDPTVKAYPQGRLPLAAWTRPALVICNDVAFSNAEIFAHAFKTLERGILLGTPTFGGVISTGGTGLINGGWIRQPLRGWRVGDSELNMENNGAVPDIIVEQPPEEDTVTERDTQLEAAVEVFLERIEEDTRYGSW
jgi:tricorn protease